MADRRVRPVEAAVVRLLGEVEGRLPGVRGSVEAKLALQLARDAQATGEWTKVSERVAAARALLEVVDRIAAAAPADEVRDPLDEIAARRAARRAS